MHIHRKNTVNEPLGKMTDPTYSSLSFLHFMNSKPAAFDRSSLDDPDRGHRPTIIRLRIMCAVLALRIRPTAALSQIPSSQIHASQLPSPIHSACN